MNARAALAAQFASSAELPDIAAGDRKALSRPSGLAADNASVDRLVRIRADSRTAFGAGRWLGESVGNAFGDACRGEWVGADDSQQSKNTGKRQDHRQLPRAEKPSLAGLFRDGRRRLARERRLVDRFGPVDPFGHALPQLLCQVVHAAHSVPPPRPAGQDTIGSIVCPGRVRREDRVSTSHEPQRGTTANAGRR